MNDELESLWKEVVMGKREVLTRHLLDELNKNTKNSVIIIWVWAEIRTKSYFRRR
jgi:hypothetical protein